MVRKRGRHDTSREIHKLGQILVVNMCAASVPYSKISLKEKDVPGTILLIYITDISNIYLYDLGALRAPLPARAPDRWSRTNPNFAQTQSSNKSKLRTNPNFE